jgi:hypothetical protein
MHTETVEIYSDQSNAAVMRHPGRKFPGVLIQGDTLYGMCAAADASCDRLRGTMDEDGYSELNELRNYLWSLLTQYKTVLAAHKIQLPFSESQGV